MSKEIEMMNRSIARFHAINCRRVSLEKFCKGDKASPEELKSGLKEIQDIKTESWHLVRGMRADLQRHNEVRVTLMNNPEDIGQKLFDMLFFTEELKKEKRLGINQRKKVA